MSFITSWFDGKKKSSPYALQLGRASDAYKTPAQYRMWDEAIVHHRKGEFVQALMKLIEFIALPDRQNLKMKEGRDIAFCFYQGSKRIEASLHKEYFRAHVQLAGIIEPDEIWMQQLLESNYHLQYCRYSIKDETVRLLFDSPVMDLTPHKFYYALRELAIVADKMDDLLLQDFPQLKPIDNQHVVSLDAAVVQEKVKFFKSRLGHYLDTWSDIGREDARYHLMSYSTLDLVYTLDYLLTPQGKIMDAFERIHNLYFNMSLGQNARKNQEAFRILGELISRTDQEIAREFYEVRHTFGVVKPVDAETIQALFRGEINNLRWYASKGDDRAVEHVAGYLFGFSMFSYAPPEPLLRLCQLFFQLRDERYLQTLDAQWKVYGNDSGHYNLRALNRHLRRLENEFNESYPHIELSTARFEGETLKEVAWGLIDLIQTVNWEEEI